MYRLNPFYSTASAVTVYSKWIVTPVSDQLRVPSFFIAFGFDWLTSFSSERACHHREFRFGGGAACAAQLCPFFGESEDLPTVICRVF